MSQWLAWTRDKSGQACTYIDIINQCLGKEVKQQNLKHPNVQLTENLISVKQQNLKHPHVQLTKDPISPLKRMDCEGPLGEGVTRWTQ
jgi:hypothetical protein